MRKQHPHHDRIAELIRAGKSDRSIYDRLKVSRKYIRQVRADAGMAPFNRTKSIEDQLSRFTSVPGPDGHMWWTGSVSTSGAPRIRINGREVPAAHAVFERRSGRKVQGQVRSDCVLKHCVAPGHLMDDLERRKVRLQTRALLGYPAHWDTCPVCGSDWDDEGRVEEKLTLYCRRCATERKRLNQKGTGS